MLRERARVIGRLMFMVDMVLTILAFFLAYFLRNAYLSQYFGHLFPLSQYSNLLIILIPIWGFLFLFFNPYCSFRTSSLVKEVYQLFKIIFSGSLILTLWLFLLKYDFVSRLFVSFFASTNFILVIAFRLLVRGLSRWARRKGYNYRNMLIVGTERRALEFAKMVEDRKGWGIRILGFVSDNGMTSTEKIEKLSGYKLLGSLHDIPKIIENEVIDEVVFVVSRNKISELEDILLILEQQGIKTRIALNFFPHLIAKPYISSLDNIPLLSFSTTPPDGSTLFIKRIIDIFGSLSLLILLSPLFLLVSAIIKVTSKGGPVLFKQVRCGLNGRKFICYKFRTMVADAEERKTELLNLNEVDGPVFKIRNDPRITWFGRFLRKTSIDEFPQLFNVLKGDMSLVGPRPPIPSEVEKYERRERRKLSMRPGITCLWQVNGRNKLDFNTWMKLDLEYIDNWNLSLDFKIFLKTIPTVLRMTGQ